MRRISLIVRSVSVILLTGLLILLVTQNLESVRIRFITLEASVPLIGVILVSLFCGLVMGNVLAGIFSWRNRDKTEKNTEPLQKKAQGPEKGGRDKK